MVYIMELITIFADFQFIKHGIGCTLRYGRQNYDYQEGSVVSFAPGQIIQLKVIDQSKHLLLSTDMTINQIADMLGFQYPQHFIRMFKSSNKIKATMKDFT